MRAGPLGLVLGVRLWHEHTTRRCSGSGSGYSLRSLLGSFKGPAKWCLDKVEITELAGCDTPGRR